MLIGELFPSALLFRVGVKASRERRTNVAIGELSRMLLLAVCRAQRIALMIALARVELEARDLVVLLVLAYPVVAAVCFDDLYRSRAFEPAQTAYWLRWVFTNTRLYIFIQNFYQVLVKASKISSFFFYDSKITNIFIGC